jgi:hypothetical protein
VYDVFILLFGIILKMIAGKRLLRFFFPKPKRQIHHFPLRIKVRRAAIPDEMLFMR